MPTITDTPTLTEGALFTWGSGTVWFRVDSIEPDGVRFYARKVGESEEGSDTIVFFDRPGRLQSLNTSNLDDLVIRTEVTVDPVDPDAETDQLRAEIALLTERLMSAVNGGEFPGYDRFLDGIEDELSAITLPERSITQTYNLNVRVTVTGHPDRIHTAALAAAEAIGEFDPTEHYQCQVASSNYNSALLVT